MSISQIISDTENLKLDQKEENFAESFKKHGIKPTKTGTTIVGVRTKDCVILAADTRATNGPVVADKHCFKLHKVSDDIYCAGAGTAADTDRVTSYCASMIRIFETKYRKKAPIEYAVNIISKHLFRYGGFIGAAIILAGRYRNTYHLYSISPDGTVMPRLFETMGSGTFCAISELESHYSQDLTKEQACDLAANAVKSGILNDLYSGSNVDLVVMDNQSTTVKRRYLPVCDTMKGKQIHYDTNSVKILKEEIWDYIEEVQDE